MALHDQAIELAAARCLPRPPQKLRLLDVGCGLKPYEPMFQPWVSEHVGLDLADTRYDASRVDLFGSAVAVPAEDASFDIVLSTSNLEHVEEPALALREWQRVLKPGGTLFLTVPLFWHEHDAPRDFFRFTRFGLEHLCTQADLRVLDLRSIGGFWTTASTMLSYALQRRHRRWLAWVPLLPTLGCGLQIIGSLLDRRDPADRWTCLYLVVAQKD